MHFALLCIVHMTSWCKLSGLVLLKFYHKILGPGPNQPSWCKQLVLVVPCNQCDPVACCQPLQLVPQAHNLLELQQAHAVLGAIDTGPPGAQKS